MEKTFIIPIKLLMSKNQTVEMIIGIRWLRAYTVRATSYYAHCNNSLFVECYRHKSHPRSLTSRVITINIIHHATRVIHFGEMELKCTIESMAMRVSVCVRAKDRGESGRRGRTESFKRARVCGTLGWPRYQMPYGT